jgi:hypothetical protein
MNMRIEAKNIDELIDKSGSFKKSFIMLDRLIMEVLPGIDRKLFTGTSITMLGYGFFNYKDYKGVVSPWPAISIAPQKNYLSLYLMGIKDDKYISEMHANKLGKASVGKSCIRFKEFDDLDLNELKIVINETNDWLKIQSKSSEL